MRHQRHIKAFPPRATKVAITACGQAHPRLLDATFKKAPRAKKAVEEQMPLGTGEIEEPF